jgi:hypothetical protein
MKFSSFVSAMQCCLVFSAFGINSVRADASDPEVPVLVCQDDAFEGTITIKVYEDSSLTGRLNLTEEDSAGKVFNWTGFNQQEFFKGDEMDLSGANGGDRSLTYNEKTGAVKLIYKDCKVMEYALSCTGEYSKKN